MGDKRDQFVGAMMTEEERDLIDWVSAFTPTRSDWVRDVLLSRAVSIKRQWDATL